ncbi:MAG: GFA family protein [Casimicrobiaceae bacterium]
MRVRGSCHCGEIAYTASVEADGVTICHCTDCQKLSGGAYRVTVRAAAEGFSLLSGKPKSYIKTAQSGAKRVQAFCGTCGSPVYSHAAEGVVTSYGLRLGGIDQRHQLRPRKQIWCHSALDWVADLSPLPRAEHE